jgi:hypothetical protein
MSGDADAYHNTETLFDKEYEPLIKDILDLCNWSQKEWPERNDIEKRWKEVIRFLLRLIKQIQKFTILPFIIKLLHYLDQMNAEIYCQKFSSNLLECLSGSTMELLEDFDLVLPKRIR